MNFSRPSSNSLGPFTARRFMVDRLVEKDYLDVFEIGVLMTRAFVCYVSSDSDGITVEYLCDGTYHAEQISTAFDDEVILNMKGLCDGKCSKERNRVDVRAKFEKARRERLKTETGFVYSSFEMDEASQALLRGKAPVFGTEIRWWYTKRNSEGSVLCLGGRHLIFSTSYHPYHREQTEVFNTHRLRMEVCDGRCRKPVRVSQYDRRNLRRQMA